MKLTVKNFGPIAEAKNIEVSPMTIFVGHSNTGKSYLATLIYSIFKVLMEGSRRRVRYSLGAIHAVRKGIEGLDLFNVNDLKKPQSDAFARIEKDFHTWAYAIHAEWRNQFAYYFGAEGQNIIETTEGDKKLSVEISDSENQVILDLTYPKKSKLTDRKKKDIYQAIKKLLSEKTQVCREIGVDDEEIIFHQYYDELSYQLHTAFSGGDRDKPPFIPYYLPAIRGGIMQSHRTLISSLIERVPMVGLSRFPPISLFSGVLSDFMQKLIHIGDGEIKAPLIKRASKAIEKSIISGEIYIQKSEVGYPDFRYRFKANGKEHDVPLMSASSSVSEMAPILLFIRHYLDVGDWFIVEEPEAHLHPAAQRDISNVFAQLVNAGVNVLITTHSDYILDQVSNFIYAADLPDSGKTQLEEKKCSAYLFDQSGRGKIKKTKVKKVPFDPETGLLTQDHLDVSSALYNETITLMEQRDNADD